MISRFFLLFGALGFWLTASLALAGVEQVSEKEFHDLAEELAPKVNLFQAAWKEDPNAKFYGGTTRDYLYWLKGQFTEVKTKAEAAAVVRDLRAQPMLDVKSFIIGDSDIDIVTKRGSSLEAKTFGVRKIDTQSPAILDAATEAGKNEWLQGYIPAEKILLGQKGFEPTGLGDGLSEIYSGKLSVHFSSAEDFAKSKYAKEGLNHPVLLALRYVRLQALNYYRTHGSQFPDPEKLMQGIDPKAAAEVKSVIERVMKSGELDTYLKNHPFRSWLNAAIQKAFRSYTNPAAALALMKQYGVNLLPERYVDLVEPLNQYVFNQYRDEPAIEKALVDNGVNREKFFMPVESSFPNGKFYHGTKTEEAFRGIIFQGALPSGGGSAGKGLYGVSANNREFSETWGGNKDRLLEFNIKPTAKLVNITEGEGAKVWRDTASLHQGNYEKFADLFGIDILRYPYNGTEAYVVKNAAVLSGAKGVYRKLAPLPELLKIAQGIHSAPELEKLITDNILSPPEQDALWRASKVTGQSVLDFLKSGTMNVRGILSSKYWQEHEGKNNLLQAFLRGKDMKTVWEAIAVNGFDEDEENYLWDHSKFLLGDLKKFLGSPDALQIDLKNVTSSAFWQKKVDEKELLAAMAKGRNLEEILQIVEILNCNLKDSEVLFRNSAISKEEVVKRLSNLTNFDRAEGAIFGSKFLQKIIDPREMAEAVLTSTDREALAGFSITLIHWGDKDKSWSELLDTIFERLAPKLSFWDRAELAHSLVKKKTFRAVDLFLPVVEEAMAGSVDITWISSGLSSIGADYLTKEEKEKIFQLAQRRGPYRDQLIGLVLKSGPAHATEWAANYVEHRIENFPQVKGGILSRFGEQKNLLENLKGTDRFKKVALTILRQNTENVPGDLNTLRDIAGYLKDDAEAKNLVFGLLEKRMDTESSRRVEEISLSFTMTGEELARYLDKASYYTPKVVMEIVDRNRGNIEQPFAEALVRFYFKEAAGGFSVEDKELSEKIISVLTTDRMRPVWQKYAQEIISGYDKNLTYLRINRQSLRPVAALIKKGLAVDRRMAMSILSMLESPGEGTSLMLDVLGKFPLQDPEVSARVQKLILSQNHVVHIDWMKDIYPKMPTYSPEFYEYLKKSAAKATFPEHELSILKKFASRQETVLRNAQRSCAQAFAKVTKIFRRPAANP